MELVRRVEKINPAAGAFMRGLLDTEAYDFSYCDSLSSCFVWKNTPQGFNYWERINAKLKTILTI